jgi:pSer/pThr/pTyr-binding forkhead associated (FHA) protein
MDTLRIYHEDRLLGIFTLFQREIALGRDRAQDLILPHADVARRHAVIQKEGRHHLLSHASSKAVLVNNAIVSVPVPLSNDDLIVLGPYAIVYESSPLKTAPKSETGAPPPHDQEGLVLSVVGGSSHGKAFPIRKEVTRIGRGSKNDIVFPDLSVSTHHAELERKPDGIFLRDLNATNGTWIRGQRHSYGPITIGEQIDLGKMSFVLRRPGKSLPTVTLLGKSGLMTKISSSLQEATHAGEPLLFQSEWGCETRGLAEEIHRIGANGGSPFLTIDCTEFPDAELLSELWGLSPSEGLFGRAGNGTLLLEGVDRISSETRDAIFSALQTGRFAAVGGGESHPISFRTIFSVLPNFEPPKNLICRCIPVLPLRERKEDIPLWVESFGKSVAPAAIEALLDYSWPGNVFELQNTLERAVILMENTILRKDHLHFLPPRPSS